MLFLLSEGHFLDFFLPKQGVSENCHFVILETPGRLQFWKTVATGEFLILLQLKCLVFSTCFFPDRADPMSISLSNGHLNLAISVLH